MAINLSALLDPIVSHALAAGVFDEVQTHEPKSAPGNGLTYAVFVNAIAPAIGGSGLTATTVRVELIGRIYKPFVSQPEDLIDSNVTDALDILFDAYSGDFEMGGTTHTGIDLLGAYGQGLAMRAGYQTIDKTVFRVLDITIPIIVNDAFVQGA